MKPCYSDLTEKDLRGAPWDLTPLITEAIFARALTPGLFSASTHFFAAEGNNQNDFCLFSEKRLKVGPLGFEPIVLKTDQLSAQLFP
jgi:hypothetical protein